MSVRRLPFAIASAVALLLAAPASAQAPKDGGRYLHDLMKQPTYRDAWTRMLGKLGPRESWLKADKLTGPGGPSTIVTVGGQAWIVDADGEERAQFPLGDPHTAHPLGDGVVLATEGTALTWWRPGRAPVPLEHDFEVVTTSALPDGVVAWSDTALYEWRSPRP